MKGSCTTYWWKEYRHGKCNVIFISPQMNAPTALHSPEQQHTFAQLALFCSLYIFSSFFSHGLRSLALFWNLQSPEPPWPPIAFHPPRQNIVSGHFIILFSHTLDGNLTRVDEFSWIKSKVERHIDGYRRRGRP